MIFSILIATYNSAKHIKPCLESINNQTFKDFELIIMDGKSSDKTLDIIREISPFAKITSEKDSGIYNALNNGLNKTKGKWLYILGSDDCFANENVLMEVNSNIEDNLSMIYGNIITKKQNIYRTLKMKDPSQYRSNNNLTPPIFHQTVFIKSEKLIKTGLAKSYVSIQENVPFLRGKLLLTRQIQNDISMNLKFGCEYDEYSSNIIENQIILYVL